ncbi:MAG: guanylate kinase [Desulfobacterota bacterium]|nr:guanylate kinase [Thermodesulfobacteriota bacterium]
MGQEPEGLDQGKGRGLVFILSAPSGAGKTTLIRRVLEELPGLRFSVSYTTRPPRANEREGVDYHFVTPEVFRKMIEGDQFLEWAEVLGHYYGTARIQEEALREEGIDLILDIDPQGARQAKAKLRNAVLIFVLPPSLEVLRERLVGRGLDSHETIQFRLAHAKEDLKEAHWYDHLLVNDRIEDAVKRLKSIMVEERRKKEDPYGESHGGRLLERGGEPV